MKFKPRLRDTVGANVRLLTAMGEGVLPPDLQESLDRMDIKPVKRRAASVRVDREGPVVRAVKQLLAVHPRVLFALRMNSGAASYEDKSGKWAPVKFHEWIQPCEGYRMSDILGATTDYRILAIECKAPGFTHPTDLREREQAAFLRIVNSAGGIGIFATSAQEVADALK